MPIVTKADGPLRTDYLPPTYVRNRTRTIIFRTYVVIVRSRFILNTRGSVYGTTAVTTAHVGNRRRCVGVAQVRRTVKRAIRFGNSLLRAAVGRRGRGPGGGTVENLDIK